MGSSNSPAIACRITNSVLRQIKEVDIEFMGNPTLNTWKEALEGTPLNNSLGYGQNLVNKFQRPISLLWSMADDFLIHSRTREECWKAFYAFLDHMLRVGFICQVRKTHPPSHCQKFCGLLFDTSSLPVLKIPEEKLSRCKATIQYIRSLNETFSLSRLSLAIATGLLQSVVDATPSNQGQTHLRALYDNIHKDTKLEGKELYYSPVTLSENTLLSLAWWDKCLSFNPGNYSRIGNCKTLCVNWGDGSGTGTGGTCEVLKDSLSFPTITSFMGVWKPHVVKFDSNWRELKTVAISLMYLVRNMPESVRGGTVFYFTDNLVTYYIVNHGSSRSPALHALVHEIKLLELQLHCNLEVIHVPGDLMIQQQSDNLSRGIPLSQDRMLRSTRVEAAEVLQPVKYSWGLQRWACTTLHLSKHYPLRHLSDLSHWNTKNILHQITIWTPSPEVARQAVDCFLTYWVESPYDTAAIFLIPRVLQRDWHFMSKHVQEVGVYHPPDLPSYASYSSLIPFCLLFCPFFTSRLPTPKGMDSSSNSNRFPEWYREQADALRRLS